MCLQFGVVELSSFDEAEDPDPDEDRRDDVHSRQQDARGKQRRLELKLDRVDYWVGKGAKPSERVAELVKNHRKQQAVAA